MKLFLKFLAVFLIGLLIGLFWPTFRGKYLSKYFQTEKEVAPENHFNLSKDDAAYLVWWDQDNGFSDLKEHYDQVNYLKPFWYEVKEDGSLKKFSGSGNPEIIKFCQDKMIKILPVISNEQDPDRLDQILSDAAVQAKHIENIINLINENGYDGVEIDYESLKGSSDRTAYTAFMTALSEKLHQNNKILATALHAKESDKGTWEGPETQDWAALNEIADQLSIMTYDYHWSTSEAGDIAPLSWMRSVLNYAKTTLDPQKTYLGIHLYAYDWVDESANDLVYSDVAELINKYQPQIKTSEEGEKYFTYSKDEENHTVYFADNETIINRIQLVNEYNLAGISLWRLGQEDPKIWQTISNVLKTY